MILYKYRDFSNIEFGLDIFINQRLYAANFKALNDPMEGRFVYSKGLLNREALMSIRGDKAEYRILSLGKSQYNMLMWSYYAGGHAGFVVGVEIDDEQADVEEVEYVDENTISHMDVKGGDLPKVILKRKLKLWDHEQEFRVFQRNQEFVKVKVRELIFGLKTDAIKKEMLSKIATKFCPDVEISTLSRDQLNTGEAGDYDF